MRPLVYAHCGKRDSRAAQQVLTHLYLNATTVGGQLKCKPSYGEVQWVVERLVKCCNAALIEE